MVACWFVVRARQASHRNRPFSNYGPSACASLLMLQVSTLACSSRMSSPPSRLSNSQLLFLHSRCQPATDPMQSPPGQRNKKPQAANARPTIRPVWQLPCLHGAPAWQHACTQLRRGVASPSPSIPEARPHPARGIVRSPCDPVVPRLPKQSGQTHIRPPPWNS